MRESIDSRSARSLAVRIRTKDATRSGPEPKAENRSAWRGRDDQEARMTMGTKSANAGRKLAFARAAIVAGAIAIAAVAPVAAAAERGEQNGVGYEFGGWNADDRAQLESRAGSYPLMLGFAWSNAGNYLADVALKVEDAKGRTLVNLDECGPIVLLKLPAGSYRLTAARAGKVQTRAVQVTSGARSAKLYLYWPRDAAESGDPRPVEQSPAVTR